MYARRRHRRRYSRRRNPALLRGLPIPNLMDAGVAVAGGVGSKWIAKTVLPQATGWFGPLATLGAGIGLGFVANMLRMRQLARPLVMGATIVAGIDALRMTPIGAQLGEYYFPGGYTPMLGSGGVGALPTPFMAQQNLAEGDYFMAEENLS